MSRQRKRNQRSRLVGIDEEDALRLVRQLGHEDIVQRFEAADRAYRAAMAAPDVFVQVDGRPMSRRLLRAQMRAEALRPIVDVVGRALFGTTPEHPEQQQALDPDPAPAPKPKPQPPSRKPRR